MPNAFDDHFAAASSVFFDSFGETGGVEYFATAGGSATAWADAIVDTGDIDAFELIDSRGDRVSEVAQVTIAAGTSWATTGLVRVGGVNGVLWHIVGLAMDSGTLITLALSRTNNSRMNRSPGRSSVRNR